jgi:hypothetical protein
MNDYVKYRGKCKAMSEELCNNNSSLTLVRGYYFCPFWNVTEQHWWTKETDGTIVDPTKEQYPSKGNGEYIEFDGMCECEECGALFPENKGTFHGSHAFCSYICYGRCIGVVK